jgi:peptidoglycan/LPS O-acetylase OafA/YrhL
VRQRNRQSWRLSFPAGDVPSPPMKERLENIQALRGVAALMVLVAHVKEAEIDYGGDGTLLPHFLYMGVVGVDLFFLISGFVMAHVALAGARGGAPAQRFLYNRAARIYPVYWAATVLLIVLYAGKQLLFAEATPFPNPVATFLLAPSDFFPLVPVGWTLVHEMYFYIVFALFVFQRRLGLPLFIGLWAATIIAALAAGVYDANAWTKVAFNPLTFEFIAGALIALAIRKGVTRFALPALAAGVAIFAIEVIFFADVLYPDVMGEFALRAAIFAPPFALVLYGAAALEQQKASLAPAWMRRVGDASYSIYLIHIPAFLVVGKLISISVADTRVDNFLLIAAFAASAIIAGFALHHFVERPLLAATRKFGDKICARSGGQ